MTSPPRLEDYAGLTDRGFDIRYEGESVYHLELDRAEALRAGADGGERGFELRFLGQAEAFLAQGTYTLLNEELGEHEVFVVPIGRREEDQRFIYQACFN